MSVGAGGVLGPGVVGPGVVVPVVGFGPIGGLFTPPVGLVGRGTRTPLNLPLAKAASNAAVPKAVPMMPNIVPVSFSFL